MKKFGWGLNPPTNKLWSFGLRSMTRSDERHGRIIHELNSLLVFNDKRLFCQTNNPIQNNLQVNASVIVQILSSV